MTNLVTIPTPPTAPSRADRNTFATRADAWLAWESADFIPGINDVVDFLNNMTGTSWSSVSTSTLTISSGTKNLTIEANKSYALGQMILIASTANANNYMTARVTAYNSVTGEMTVDVITIGGSGTYSSWSIGLAAMSAQMSSRSISGSGVLGAADLGANVSVTGTGTLTLPSASVVGDGWWAIVNNSGDGDILLSASTPVEFIANGTFTGNATGWTLGANWSYDTNNVMRTGNLTPSSLSQTINNLVVGSRYRLTIGNAVSISSSYGDYAAVSMIGSPTIEILRVTDGTTTPSPAVLNFVANQSSMTFSLTISSASSFVYDNISVIGLQSGQNSIDTFAEYYLYPFESRLIYSNGTELKSVLLKGGRKIFTTSGYFMNPPGVESVCVDLFGGGGGGGSGKRGPAGTDRKSGGGGGGGAHHHFVTRMLPGEQRYATVGAGGAGGAAVTANNTEGFNGTAGGYSDFTDHAFYYALRRAYGGDSGKGSATVATTFPDNGLGGGVFNQSPETTGSVSNYVGGNGGILANGITPYRGGFTGYGSAGGGCGGVVLSTNVASTGAGSFGSSYSTTPVGTNGENGKSYYHWFHGGGGGSGGGGNGSGVGGNGGAGGFPGGGGGGGGASLDNFTSGAGGAGANGAVIITWSA